MAGFHYGEEPVGPFFPRLSLVLAGEDDYRRTGPRHSRQESGWAPGWMEFATGLGAPLQSRDLPWWGTETKNGSQESPFFHISGAVGHQRADPEGLFVSARVPALRAGAAFAMGPVRTNVLIFGVGVADVGSWDWAEAFRDRVVGGGAEFRHGSESLAMMGAFERYPGDTALPALVLPLPGQPRWSDGRAAARDEDIRTYGVRLSSDRLVRAKVALFNQRGRSVAVTPDGGRSPLTTKSVAAGAAYVSLSGFPGSAIPLEPEGAPGKGSQSDCALMPLALLCSVIPEVPAPLLEVSALALTADRDPSDHRAHGFAGPAARPSVMGGPFSILLVGPGPGGERAPFARSRARNAPVDRQGVDPDESALRTENRPDRENTGVRMGSFHVAAARPLGRVRLQLDFFANYARYLTGEGYEGLVLLAGRPGTASSLRVVLAAAMARYRSSSRQSNVWTGLDEPAQTEYYRRFFLVAAWSY